jgi:Zn finger protein HypA/HybF involved in hydrogenase expression
LICPECGSINIEVISGREMLIKEIEVDWWKR